MGPVELELRKFDASDRDRSARGDRTRFEEHETGCAATEWRLHFSEKYDGEQPGHGGRSLHHSEGAVPCCFGSHIVVGWNDERYRLKQAVRGVNSSVGYAVSTDGGSTFTDSGELGTSHWGADPTLAVDRAGNFYFARIDLSPGSTLDRIAVYKSTDGGVSFP